MNFKQKIGWAGCFFLLWCPSYALSSLTVADHAQSHAWVSECALHLRISIQAPVSVDALGALYPCLLSTWVRYCFTKGISKYALDLHTRRNSSSLFRPRNVVGIEPFVTSQSVSQRGVLFQLFERCINESVLAAVCKGMQRFFFFVRAKFFLLVSYFAMTEINCK